MTLREELGNFIALLATSGRKIPNLWFETLTLKVSPKVWRDLIRDQVFLKAQTPVWGLDRLRICDFLLKRVEVRVQVKCLPKSTAAKKEDD